MIQPRLASAALLAALLPTLLLVACGDDENPEEPTGGAAVGEACQVTADCADDLLCIGLLCRDPSVAPNNNPNNNTPNNNSNNNSSNNNNELDAGNNNPTPDAELDVAETDDAAPDVDEPDVDEPDAPPVERPTVLTGGISLFEAHIKANNFITLHRGNMGAAFVVPSDDPEPTLDVCATFQATTATPATPGYSAGAIQATGAARSFVLTPTPQSSLYVYTSNQNEENEEAFNSGATVTLSAAGGPHIPAFSGMITAPADHAVTRPAADSTFSGAIDLGWSNSGSDASVIINMTPLTATYQPSNGLGINCVLSGDPGSFTIPAELTSQLVAPLFALSVIRVRNETLQVGPDTLILNATYSNGVIVKR